MGGSLLQLVAKGADDIYLIRDPQITLFKMVYRRHANFSMFPFNLNFARKMNFGTLGKCRIRKNGDLINKLNLVVKLPAIKMAYPKLTKKELQTQLALYGVTWTVPINELNDPVTQEDYKVVEALVNEQIKVLLAEETLQKNRKTIINTKFRDPSTTNGRDYANAVFPELIKGDALEPLYNYLFAFKGDLPAQPIVVQNSDDDLIAFYNDLITKLIIKDLTFPLLSDNIIFYQVMEFGNYTFNQSILNYNMKYIFDKALESGYAIHGVDTASDSFKVYNKYFKQLIGLRATI